MLNTICTVCILQGGSNMTGTNCDLFTHNQSRSYLNHLVLTTQHSFFFKIKLINRLKNQLRHTNSINMATHGTTNVKLELISFCGMTYLYFQLLYEATPARKTNYIPGEESIFRCIWHSQGDEYDHQEHPGRDNM